MDYYRDRGSEDDMQYVESQFRRFRIATGMNPYTRHKRRTRARWALGLTKALMVVITDRESTGESTTGRGTHRLMRLSVEKLQARNDYAEHLVQHELGHVVGLRHEHQRPDRDDHIILDESQLDNKYSTRLNYDIISLTWNLYLGGRVFVVENATTFDTPYDHESNMHYTKHITTLAGSPHHAWRDNKSTFGALNNNSFLSPWDIYTVKKLYDITPNPNPGYTPPFTIGWRIINCYGTKPLATIYFWSVNDYNNTPDERLTDNGNGWYSWRNILPEGEISFSIGYWARGLDGSMLFYHDGPFSTTLDIFWLKDGIIYDTNPDL